MTSYLPMLERSRIRISQGVQPLAQMVSRGVKWVQSLVSNLVSKPFLTVQNTNSSMSGARVESDVERSSRPQPTPAQDRWRQSLTLIFAITQVAASALSVVSGIGTPVGDISDKFFTSVTAAGYAFAIWALIYSTCLAYGVYQALPAQRDNELLRRIGWWTASAFLGNSVWIPAFQLEQFWLSVLIIGWIMVSLAGVLREFIRYGRELPKAQTWLTVVPLSIFAGWITAATVLNVSVALKADGLGANLLSASSWGTLMTLVVGVLGSYVTFKSRGNWGYGLTLVWALVAIIVAQAPSSLSVAIGSSVAIVAILVSLGWARAVRAPLAPLRTTAAPEVAPA